MSRNLITSVKRYIAMLTAIIIVITGLPMGVYADSSQSQQPDVCTVGSIGYKDIHEAVEDIYEGKITGTIKLIQDIELEESLYIATQTDLDLNGHVLSIDSSEESCVIYVGSEGVLTLNDSDPSVQHGFDNSEAAWTWQDTTTAAVVLGGCITGGCGDNLDGGGICNYGTVIMNGGNIVGNSGEYGGGVYNYSEFIMHGGSITGNYARYGGGIYQTGDQLIIDGGSISHNDAYRAGGIFAYVSNSPVLGGDAEIIDNGRENFDLRYAIIEFGDGTNGAATPTDLKCSVTVDVFTSSAAIISTASAVNYSSNIIPDNDSFTVGYSSDASGYCVTLNCPDYSLYVADGKVYKNNTGGEDITATVSDSGLKYNDDDNIWEMTDFSFISCVDNGPAVEFADADTELALFGSCLIENTSAVGDSSALKLASANICASGHLECMCLSSYAAVEYTGDLEVYESAYLMVVAPEITLKAANRAFANVATWGDDIHWDEDLKQYVNEDGVAPSFITISRLIHFDNGLGDNDCTFDTYSVGEKYAVGTRDNEYEFAGWYPDGDYSLSPLSSDEEKNEFVTYIAKWIKDGRTVNTQGILIDSYYSSENNPELYETEYLGAKWDESTKTLTINNVYIDNVNGNPISVPADTKIIVKGDNTVIGCWGYGLFAMGNVSISGGGTLNIEKLGQIYVNGNFNINNANINVKSGDDVYCNGNIVLSGDSRIKVYGEQNETAFYACGAIYADGMYGGLNDILETGFVSGETNYISIASDSEPAVLYSYTPVYIDDNTVTVKASSEGTDMGSLNLSATVSGNTATVSIDSKELTTIKEKGKTASGNPTAMTLDLSSLSSAVTGLSLDTKTFNEIAAIIADDENDINNLEIKLPEATVILYEETVNSILAQAGGDKLSINISSGSKAEAGLSDAQKELVTGMNNPMVVDAEISSGGKAISDFSGGSVAVRVKYKTDKSVRAYYVDDSGNKEKVDCIFDGETVVFVAKHFSVYVIEEYDYSNCSKDILCPLDAYSDLDASLWYHDGIHFCIEKGYMNGYGNGLFGTGDSISRGMIARILYNIEGSPAVAEKSGFTDVAEGLWYSDAIAWTEDNGIFDGYGNNLFGPDDTVSREQLAKILFSYAKYKGFDISSSAEIDSFTDASEASSWAVNALKWATAVKLMGGKGNGILDPKGGATRAEAATMIKNFCENM